MAEEQKPTNDKTEASVAEQKAVEVPTPAAPVVEKKEEPVPAAPVVPDEKKAEPTPAQPETPVENTEAAKIEAEPVVPAKTAEENSAPAPVVQEEVQPPAEETKVVAPVKDEPAASEVKPETANEKKVTEPTNEANAAEVKKEAVVEKEVVQEKPVVEKPATSAVAVEKIDAPVESHPAETAAEEKTEVPAAVEKEVATAEIVQQPAETKAEEDKPSTPAQQGGDKTPVEEPENVVTAPSPAQEPKKSNGPDKTSVTLAPDGSGKKSVNNEETEAFLRENMPEGHTYEKTWKIFYAFDHDLNGTIAMCELADALRCCGLYVSQKEVHRLKLNLELEHHRVINFGQFCKFLVIRKKDSVERLTKAFMRFDKERTGYIDTIELRRCLTTMGEALTKTQVDDMLKGLDVNSDGKVEFQEFVDYMLSEQQL